MIHKSNLAPSLLMAILAVLPVAFSGCATTSGPEGSVVLIDGRKLGKKIEVDELKFATTETGTQKVWTTIHNKTKAPLALEARAVFRGEKGEPVEPESGWTQVFVQPRTSASFDGLSMSTKAKQAIVEIRVGNLVGNL
jgi:uncharacterized protein YcfL